MSRLSLTLSFFVLVSVCSLAQTAYSQSLDSMAVLDSIYYSQPQNATSVPADTSYYSELFLKELVVTSTVPQTKLKGTTIETRITGSVLEHAGNAEDVLSKVPGMMKQGSDLEVIGKGTPIYFVNGRRLQDASELKLIMSEQIRSVEVITNPGADYDASVGAVVKIKTKRQQGEGLSLDAGAVWGQNLERGEAHPGANSSLNYRLKSWDFFGAFNFWSGVYHQEGNFGGGTYSKALTHEQFGDLWVKQRSHGLEYTIGSNWQISSNISVGAMIRLFHTPYEVGDKIMDENIIRNGVYEEHLITNDHWDMQTMKGYVANAYYYGQVGNLTIDWNLDLVHRKSSLVDDIDEISELRNNVFNTYTSRLNDMFATKLVLSYPYKKSNFRLGTEWVRVHSDNGYTATSELTSNSESDIRETTGAFFAEYSLDSPIGRWQAGLRYEHVNMDYKDVLNPATKMNRKRDEFFPFFSVNETFGPVNMTLSYSVKTRRPSFWQLNDAMQYHSHYVYERGNSQLRNTINKTLALMTSYKWLMLEVDYLNARYKILKWCLPYNDDGTLLLEDMNLDDPVKSLSAFLNARPKFGIYQPNYTVGFSKQYLSLDLLDDREPTGFRHESFRKPMYLVQANNAFRIDTRNHNPWQLEVNMQYRSAMNSDNDLLKRDSWSLDAAVQKSYMEGNLTFRLEVNDLLKRANMGYLYSDFGNYNIFQNNEFRQQNLRFSVHYRLNSTKSKYRGSGAGQDVKNRM